MMRWLGLCAGCLCAQTAVAAPFSLFGLDGSYQLQGTYALAMRLRDPHPGIISTPPSAEIPIPDFLKFPESNNFDDGNRNFEKGSLVNNRLTFLGEVQFERNGYGLLLRGDAFVDTIYLRRNDNQFRDSRSVTEGSPQFPFQGEADKFIDEAKTFAGRRGRMLDAYAYGTWYFGEQSALSVRVGRHIAAWGESLFFSGVALAQAPADATKASVPGADVKSILLPVNQVSMRLELTPKLTLLGQYKLEFKPVELNPVGEFFSVSDVVGPGAQFIWGIRNPLHFSTLSEINLLSGELPETLQLVVDLLAPGLPTGALTGLLEGILDRLDPLLPDLNLPLDLIPQPNTPHYLNVVRQEDIRPSDHGQWGAGMTYQITPDTTLGLYRLRYHNTTPAPVQNYGGAVLLPGLGGLPDLTSEALGLPVPVTYNIRYFDGIDLTAFSFSTFLFGASVAGELIHRQGIDVLVDVDGGLLGPVPTPTRAEVWQAMMSALYIIGPRWGWDALTLVGEVGYVHVEDLDEACGPTSCSTSLTYDRDASAWSFLAMMDFRNLFTGWDLQVPIFLSGIINGQSSMLSGLGSLMGEGDMRASIGLNFTYLQSLQVGVSYNAFLGRPDFEKRPYADRDFVAFTARYNF